jgi:hypothetical protein
MPIGLATLGTLLKPITNCTVMIPGAPTPLQVPRILPEISDSKAASYSDEPVIGRSFPIKTFGHGENRVINMKWHFAILDLMTKQETISQMRAFMSCVYPRDGAAAGGAATNPYQPPVICTLSCQNLTYGGTIGGNSVCAVLKSYNISYPTEVVWDESTYLPLKFDMDLVWDVVYATSMLPGADKIIR